MPPPHAPDPARHPSRRSVLTAALLGGTSAAVALPGGRAAAAEQPPPLTELLRPIGEAPIADPVRRNLRYPFQLGVASGEPTAHSVVLWTRLAIEPLDPRGLGGMPRRPVEVLYQVAEDPRFLRLVRVGDALAMRENAYSVHVEITGLAPDREYFYRFRTGLHESPVGRTRTAPRPDAKGPVAFSVTSCAHWEEGFFTVYRHVAQSRPDLIVHLGDYIYASAAGKGDASTGQVRRHEGGRARTLAEYRRRHAQYKTDPDLQAAHAAAPWVVTIDDHEVANNWAGWHAWRPKDRKRFAEMRVAALQAYWENMPLPASARPRHGRMQLFRRLHWGQTAAFHVLDTRQYRDPLACGETVRSNTCDRRADPTRSLLGSRQEAWLAAGLKSSGATWDFLAQQVLFSSHPQESGYHLDTWDGYAPARNRLLAAARSGGVQNLAVLTGDSHKHWAAHILPDFTRLELAPVGVELAVTSVSSNGDGAAQGKRVKHALRDLPYVRFGDQRRGWIQVSASRQEMRADFAVVPFVSRPDAPAHRAGSFLVPAGIPGLNQL